MLFKYLVSLFVLASTSLFSCQIIFLNGTSSVGKSTIAKTLQQELEAPYLHVGIDQLIAMMPEKVNNWEGGTAELGFSWKRGVDEQGHPLQMLQVGPYAAKMSLAFKNVVTALARSDLNIIVDEVAFEENAHTAWKEALKGYDVLWVGLTADLAVIEKREKERGNRLLGQARAAAPLVHKGFEYDLFLDTGLIPTSEVVQKIKLASKSKKG